MDAVFASLYDAYAYFKIKKIQLRIINKWKFHRTESLYRRNWSLNIFSTFHGASVFITIFKKIRE
jgi:hypothetical protein